MDNRKACSKIKTIRKVHGAAAVANNKEKTRLPAKLSASLLSSPPPVYYDENSASSSSMITTEQVLYNSQTAFSSLSTSCCCFTSSYIITTETLLNQLLPPAAGKQTTAAAFVAGNSSSSSSSNKKRTKKKNTLFQNLQKNSTGVSGNQLSAKAAGACNEEDVHLYYVYTNSLCEQYKQPKKPASSLETVSSASASSSSAVLPNINKMSNKHCLRRYFTKNDTISLPSSSEAAASPTSASNSKKLPRTTATLPAAAAASSATAYSTLKPKKKSSKQLNAAADQRKTNYNYCLLIRYLCILWLVTVIKHIDLLIRLILRISTPIISTTSNHHHHIVKPTTSQPAHASRSSPPPTTAPRSATYTKNLRKALPQIGMSSFYTMLTIICLEIILLSTMSSCAKTFYMHWNTSNSIFRIDNTDHIIDVNKGNLAFEFDQVHIICPVYEPGTYENETEKYIIYNVSKVEYETCRITNADPRVIAICDKPQKLMFFTLTFRPFTPQPGGLEFLPGNDYYFISTSSKDDLYRRIGGRCSTNNMKVVFKVCCASEDKDKTTAGGGGSAGSQPRDNTSSTSASGDTKTSSSSNNAEDINGSMGQMPTNQHVNTIGNNLDHRGAGGAVNAGSGLTPNVAGPGIIDINNPAGGMVYGNNINNNGQNPNIIGTSSINSNIDQHNPFGLRPMQHPNNGYNNGLPNGIGTSNGILFTTGHGNMNMVPTGAGGGVSMSGIPQYPGLGFHGQSGIRINNIPMNQHPNMNNINMNNNHHMHHPYDKHPNEVVKNEELTYNSGASFSAAQPFYWHWKQFAVELAASLAARLMAQYELLWNKFAVGALLQAKQFYHSQNNNNNNLMLLIGASLAVMLMQQLLIYNLTLRRTSEAEGQAAAAATSALSSSVFIFKREETNIYIVSSNSYSNLPQQNTIPQTFIH